MRYRSAWIVVVAGLAMTASLAPAQDRRSRGKKYPVQALGILDWNGEVFIRSNYRQQKTTGAGRTSTNSDLMFREGFRLNSSGYVYHPNLLDWRTGFTIGSRQERSEIDGARARSSGLLLGYTVSANLLNEKPVSFRFFGGQRQDFRDQGFGESSEFREDRYGVSTRIKSTFPASFLIERIDSTQDSSTRESTSNTEHMRFAISRSEGRANAQFTFDHIDTDQRVSFVPFAGGAPVIDIYPRTQDDAKLVHRWLFGSIKDPDSLHGVVQYVNRQDASDSKNLSIEETLELIHDETLSSVYNAYYDLDDTDNQRVERITGRVGVRKDIYRSLRLSASGTARNSDFDFGEEQVYSGSASSAYRKRTPIGGYTCDLRFSHQRREQAFDGGLVLFRNERVTLTGFVFSGLANTNVQVTSIVVRNSSGGLGPGTITYSLGVDYDVRMTGATTEIARLPGSVIPPGATVLVDYVAAVAQEATYTTNTLRWSNRIRFKKIPVSLYTTVTQQRQNLEEGQDPGNIDKTDAYTVGAQYGKQGFSATVEHSVTDSKLSPTAVTNRVRLGYRKSLSRSTGLALGAHAQRLDYTDGEKFGLGPDEDFNETMGAQANLTTVLGRRALIRLTSGVTKNRGRDERTMLTNEGVLEWAYGKVDLSLRARYDILEQESSDRDSLTVRFELSRNF